jgi:prepilin-type N-terminal cleavage/methylation domain-containing protein
VKSNREGFTLLEVIVSIVLLSIIIAGLAGMTFASAQQAVFTTNAASRQALSLELVNRFSTLPYDSLANYAVMQCDSVGPVNDSYRRCVSSTASGRQSTVEITISPLQRNTSASTVRLVRMDDVPQPNPLCSPSC